MKKNILIFSLIFYSSFANSQSLWGLLNSSGEWLFVSMDKNTGAIVSEEPVYFLKNIVSQSVAIETDSSRYICMGEDNSSVKRICSIDIHTGKILYEPPCNSTLSDFKYDAKRRKLVALMFNNQYRNWWLVNVNSYNGNLMMLDSIPGMKYLQNGTSTLGCDNGIIYVNGTDDLNHSWLYMLNETMGQLNCKTPVSQMYECHYDTVSKNIYFLSKSPELGHGWYFCKLNPSTQQVTPIANIPGVQFIRTNTSAFAQDSLQYFFEDDSGNIRRMFTLNAITGKVLRRNETGSSSIELSGLEYTTVNPPANVKDTVKHNQVAITGNPKDTVPKFKIGGYVDAYYAAYTDSVGHGKPQKFGAISPYSNNFGVNIAQLTGQYSGDWLRSTITLQFGDLPTVAWSPVYNYIQEANVGVRLFKGFWLDAGFFKTHIGTESLLPKDNICSSVSVITYYEPWWQSGIKLSWTGDKEKLYTALYIVNGYNTFVALNNKKAAGLAISYNFTDNFSVGYYNFLSDNTPDSISISHWRFLNNFVINLPLADKLNAIIGADYILQQNTLNGNGYAEANSLIATLKYQCLKKMAIYGRFEMFNDPEGFLTARVGDFTLNGETFGIEYKPLGNSYIRLEGRQLNMAANEKIFYTDGQYISYRREIMVDLGVWF